MPALSFQEWMLIGIIIVAVSLIVSDLLRPDLVAILVLVILPLTGVVTYQEALSGFSRSVIITIIGLFIITQALEDSGVVQWIAEHLRHIGKGSETRLVLLFMGVGAALSLVMNNIAAGAVLLPAAVQVGRESNVPPSKLLIPLSFGTLVGGMATYFTTANIVVSSILRDQGQPGLGMLDFMPTGGFIAVMSLLFMALAGRKMLPIRESAAQGASPYLLSRSLLESYHLGNQLWEVQVLPESSLVGTTLSKSSLGAHYGVAVVAIWRGHQAILSPTPAQNILASDFLLLLGPEERIHQLTELGTVIGRVNSRTNGGQERFVDLTEIVIPPRSTVVGKTMAELHFRNKYSLTGVALWREGKSHSTDVGTIPLDVGDALLMVGTPQKIKALENEPDFLVLQSGHAARPPLPQKAGIVLTITGLVLLVSIVSIIPAAEAMLIGVAAMALTGCINLDEAYRSIGWRVIFLVAGMLPISLAMIHTGLAERAGQAIVAVIAPYGPMALVAGLFIITMLVTQVIGGQVAALMVAPIAVTAALQLGVNPQAIGVTVAIGCSAAFLTPIAHPVNVLMMGPGGYVSRDFLTIGIGMAIVTITALLIAMRLFWGIQ